MAEKSDDKKNIKSSFWWREAVGIFWTIAFIVFLRVYILEPYVIPSESMVPTLLVGDHVFVARGAYDFKLPLTNTSLVKVSDPKRGDVVVFDYPRQEDEENAGKFFVKRVIGVPGDTIVVKRGVPWVQEKILTQTSVSSEESAKEINGFKLDPRNELYREVIPNAREPFHWVQRMPERFDNLDQVIEIFRENYGQTCVEVGRGEHPVLANEVCPFVVPPNKYFVMGDNRDNSSDGRVFGFVDRSLIKGRVLFIWFSPPPGEVNPYTSGPAIFAALKDMIPGLIRMVQDSGRLARVGAPIH
ncbi:MAG: signal peptidase I [Bdellovibrionota bacterium]